MTIITICAKKYHRCASACCFSLSWHRETKRLPHIRLKTCWSIMKKIIPCHFRCSFALAFDLYRDDGHARANDNCSPRFLLLCFAGKKGTLSAPKTDTRLWETVVHPQWRRDRSNAKPTLPLHPRKWLFLERNGHNHDHNSHVYESGIPRVNGQTVSRGYVLCYASHICIAPCIFLVKRPNNIYVILQRCSSERLAQALLSGDTAKMQYSAILIHPILSAKQ